MTVPTDLYYTEEHEWVRFADDETIVLGLTAFAQDQLGAIVFVEFPDEGVEVGRGDALGQVESTKSVSDIFAPVSGTVIEINRMLRKAPELINSDPYDEGWICKMKLEDPIEKEDLMRPDEYQDHIGDE